MHACERSPSSETRGRGSEINQKGQDQIYHSSHTMHAQGPRGHRSFILTLKPTAVRCLTIHKPLVPVPWPNVLNTSLPLTHYQELLLLPSQLYLWGSPFFFFCLPSYISGVHLWSSSSAFPAVSGVHLSSSSAFPGIFLGSVHLSSSSGFPAKSLGFTFLLLLPSQLYLWGFTILLLLLLRFQLYIWG